MPTLKSLITAAGLLLVPGVAVAAGGGGDVAHTLEDSLLPMAFHAANLALLLGSIEAPHEACSQPSRAYEVTYKWSVMSLLQVFPVRLADPVHLSST